MLLQMVYTTIYRILLSSASAWVQMSVRNCWPCIYKIRHYPTLTLGKCSCYRWRWWSLPWIRRLHFRLDCFRDPPAEYFCTTERWARGYLRTTYMSRSQYHPRFWHRLCWVLDFQEGLLEQKNYVYPIIYQTLFKLISTNLFKNNEFFLNAKIVTI